MPRRKVSSISVNSLHATSPRLDFQGRTIVKDTCDLFIKLLSNNLKGPAGLTELNSLRIKLAESRVETLKRMFSADIGWLPREVGRFYGLAKNLNIIGKETCDLRDFLKTWRSNSQVDFDEQLIRLMNNIFAINPVRYSTYTGKDLFWYLAHELGT